MNHEEIGSPGFGANLTIQENSFASQRPSAVRFFSILFQLEVDIAKVYQSFHPTELQGTFHLKNEINPQLNCLVENTLLNTQQCQRIKLQNKYSP